MTGKTYCDFHNNTETRLSCVDCGKYICPECMVEAAVGFKCPECARPNKLHIEEITTQNYLTGGLAGLIAGTGAGYIWYNLSAFGALISLAIAYAVGFCISKAISASIGNKIGLRIQIFTGLITIISMVYNPIIIGTYFFNGLSPSLGWIITSMPLFYFACIIKTLALVIAIWAAIRHFKI